jgi:hypothetical protein
MIDRKEPENVEYFNHLGSMIINDERCTCEIKSRIATAVGTIKRRRFFSLAN